MPRLLTIVLLALAATFLPGSAASGRQSSLVMAPKRLACPPASPLAASRAVVAFTARWNLYACRRGRAAGRARLLEYGGGPRSLDGTWGDVVVSDGLVAWSTTSYGPRCGGHWVSAADVRHGVGLWRVTAGTFSVYSDANGCSSNGAEVHSLQVDEHGSGVFIAGSSGDYEVSVVHDGTARAVARGADIDPVSAEIGDGTAVWWQGGERRSVPLAPPAR